MTLPGNYTPAHTIWRQIELGVKMSLGARQQHRSADDRAVRFIAGPTRTPRWVEVRLTAADDYEIICGRAGRGGSIIDGPEAQIEYTASGVYWDNLNEILLQMEREVWG